MHEEKKIIFVCTYNSVRSQMAEGLMRSLHGDLYEVYSAGFYASGVNPMAIRVMKEIGIDISNQYSKSTEGYKNIEFDYVVTLCDESKDACPFFPGGKRYLYKSFQDPAQFKGTEEEILDTFRRVRDEIRDWIEETFLKIKN